ncbi:Alpha/beta-Hydrolases superfamily protein isoform 1 [Gossypium australe]|uniref:Alpha/beta-Hydrolases superfamily protein isoform 1 n=1 Tax=Gossypium australe TaxID=47621 RepID=A0A5B6UMN5_9ROSI|nr:Alpha/beta-Hydrolases superfamily protein isoform 1 [Gossypium australe]
MVFSPFAAMIAPIAVALTVGLLGWTYRALKPPPPKICGSPDGPPVTSPRIKLSDGRHLAYREAGVPREEAKYKIVVIHGFGSSKDLNLPASEELVEELRIYFLFFDRSGYGDSDPNPSRSVKSEAYDVQELADKLQIGSKFYVIGISMGAYPVYNFLLSNSTKRKKLLWQWIFSFFFRLAGASLVVPFVNYWWPCLPANLSNDAFSRLLAQDQWSFRVAHYTPWLFYWWVSQKWFPSLSILAGNMAIFSQSDLEILKKWSEAPSVGQEKIQQQGVYESLHRDIMASYGKWEFDPMDLINPFPNNEGSVHIWQGYEDRIIPFQVNRYLSEKLPWIHYHEVPDAGHLLIFESKNCEAVLRELVQRRNLVLNRNQKWLYSRPRWFD